MRSVMVPKYTFIPSTTPKLVTNSPRARIQMVEFYIDPDHDWLRCAGPDVNLFERDPQTLDKYTDKQLIVLSADTGLPYYELKHLRDLEIRIVSAEPMFRHSRLLTQIELSGNSR